MNSLPQLSAMLIARCSEIIKKFEEFYIQTGFKYNIFKIAQINEKELIICRIVADLLNPKGNHKRRELLALHQYVWV